MLEKLRTSTKVIFGFGCVMLITLVLALAARQALSTANEHLAEVGKNRVPSIYGLQEMRAGMLHVANAYRALVAVQAVDPLTRQANYDEYSAGIQQVAEGKKIYEPLPMTSEEERIWRNMMPRWEELQRAAQAAVEVERQKDSLVATGAKVDDPRVQQLDKRADDILVSARAARLECDKLINDLVQLNNGYGKAAVAAANEAEAKSTTLIAGMLLVGLLVAGILALGTARSVNGTLKRLRHEMALVTEAAVSGQLSTRADVTQVPDEFRIILQGMNDTLDALIDPLNKTRDYMVKIAKGEIPDNITDIYRGDYNETKNGLNGLFDHLNFFIAEVKAMSRRHEEGDIDVRIPEEKFEGAFRAMAKGVNDMVFGHIAVKKKAMSCIAEFGKGNFDAQLERFPGKKAFINDNVENLRSNVKLFIAEMGRMSKEHDAGDIDVRIPEEKFEGAYRIMSKGVNDMVFGHIAVKKKAMACIAEFSKGNFEAQLEKFPGKKAFINENIENLRSNIKLFIVEMARMSKEHDAGDIDVRIPEEKFEGAYRVMSKGVNDMVAGHILVKKKAMACIAEFGRGNFEAPLDKFPGKKAFINDTIEQVRSNLKALIVDTDLLNREALEGRLTTRADVARHQGDFRKIVEGINATLDSIIGPFVQVADSVEQINEATRQIAASSQSVAQGTSEQASALEETSSSLEEMSGMTKQNADNTVQAKALAHTTKEAAEKGGEAMERMTDAMEKIRSASEGTAEIIKDINEIAFQTNLLALNAAVEAARAGDAGRGFAVVAEEVRSLALRSKEAAKRTEDLIKMSVGHAENGRIISGQVAGSLSEIVVAAGKVNDIVSEIAVASQEQSRGIEQVNNAVSEMDKVVQSAASSAEESSSAAEELASQAEDLAGLISRFELGRDSNATSRPRQQAVPPRRFARAASPSPRRAAPQQFERKKTSLGNGNGAHKPSPDSVIPLGSDPEFNDF